MSQHPRATVIRKRGAPINHQCEPEAPRRTYRDSAYHAPECVCPRCDPSRGRALEPEPPDPRRAWLPKLGERIAAASTTTE